MNKFNKTLSVLLSTAVGLSMHSSNFKSFGAGGEEISLNNPKARENVLSKENLSSFKEKIYRTSENTLVNESFIPLSKNGEIIKHHDLTSTPIVTVPDSLFEDIPLHPVAAFLNKYDGPKYVEKPGTNDYGYPESFVFDDLGRILVFNKSTGKCEFLTSDEKKKYSYDEEKIVWFFPVEFYELKNVEVRDYKRPLCDYEKAELERLRQVNEEAEKILKNMQARDRERNADSKSEIKEVGTTHFIKEYSPWVLITGCGLLGRYFLTLDNYIANFDDDD